MCVNTGNHYPKVSIIIPVYNLEEYIGGCIESIVNQTYKCTEIIIVDDGSKDRSRNVCERYKTEYPDKIKIISQKNAGVSSARNVGLDYASGEYVVFVDGDDCIKENYVEILVGLAQTYGVDIVSCTYEDTFSIDERDKSSAKSAPKPENVHVNSSREAVKTLLEQKMSPSACERIYKRSVIGDIRFWIGKKNNEDKYFLFQVLRNSQKVLYINVKMYICLNRLGSASRRTNDYNNDMVEIAEKIIQDALLSNDEEISQFAEYNYYLTLLHSAKMIIRKNIPRERKKILFNRIRDKIVGISYQVRRHSSVQRRIETLFVYFGFSSYSALVHIFDKFKST